MKTNCQLKEQLSYDDLLDRGKKTVEVQGTAHPSRHISPFSYQVITYQSQSNCSGSVIYMQPILASGSLLWRHTIELSGFHFFFSPYMYIGSLCTTSSISRTFPSPQLWNKSPPLCSTAILLLASHPANSTSRTFLQLWQDRENRDSITEKHEMELSTATTTITRITVLLHNFSINISIF